MCLKIFSLHPLPPSLPHSFPPCLILPPSLPSFLLVCRYTCSPTSAASSPPQRVSLRSLTQPRGSRRTRIPPSTCQWWSWTRWGWPRTPQTSPSRPCTHCWRMELKEQTTTRRWVWSHWHNNSRCTECLHSQTKLSVEEKR